MSRADRDPVYEKASRCLRCGSWQSSFLGYTPFICPPCAKKQTVEEDPCTWWVVDYRRNQGDPVMECEDED